MTNLLITRGSVLAPFALFAFIGGFGLHNPVQLYKMTIILVI